MLRTWLVIYVFVGIQMGWVLRPFVGSPVCSHPVLPGGELEQRLRGGHRDDLGRAARGRTGLSRRGRNPMTSRQRAELTVRHVSCPRATACVMMGFGGSRSVYAINTLIHRSRE